MCYKSYNKINTDKLHSDALSKNVSNSVRGMAALFVLFHHFYQRTYFIANPYLGKIFEVMGYLAVSVFFFYSGYGLMVSYKTKSISYIKKFPENRLLPFYFTYLLFVVLSIIEKIIIGSDIAFADLIHSFFFYETIVTYGWYFQTILLFYLIFYFVFRFIKNDNMKIIMMASCVTIYIAAYHVLEVSSAKYISALSFVLGILWCFSENKIIHTKKKTVLTILISGFLFLMLLLLSFVTENRHIRYLSRAIASPLFVILLLTLISIINERLPVLIENKFTTWLGNNSLEIYVVQGIFFELLRSKLIYVENSYIYIICVFCGTMLFAPLLNKVVKLLNSLLKRKLVSS